VSRDLPLDQERDALSNRILPGLCSISFRQLDPGEVIELASAAGLAGVEWGADRHVPVGEHETARRVAEDCAAAGLACPSYGTYIGMDPSKGSVEEACSTAVALGARNIRVWTPMGTDHTADAETRASIVADLVHVCSVAAGAGLTVGLEFHGWTLTHTGESARRLLEEVAAPNLFTYWQPIYWDDEINTDPARQVAEFDLVADHVSHLHAYWWTGFERHPLAAGDATWTQILPRAAETNRWSAPRYAFLEFVADDDPEHLSSEASTLSRWLGSIG
jgi:sugar phosphate isomerase/epimerase